jgi:MYXO-CTERM domain-containing protein
MVRQHALSLLLAALVVVGLGTGCGGAGCSFLKPLPAEPKPLGIPGDQVIEGGIQARITKPGVDKLAQSVPRIIGSSLSNGFCASQSQNLFNVLGQSVDVCLQPSATCMGNTGCSAYVYLDSKNRPASHVTGDVMPPPPANDQDNKLGFKISVLDSPPAPNPQIVIDAYLDVLVPVKLSASGPISGSCYLYAYTPHVDNDAADPLHMVATIDLKTDPTTGELTIHLHDLTIPDLAVTTDGVGGVCGFISDITSFVLSFLNGLPDIIKNFILQLLTPTIDNALQGFLPKPLGLAGTVDTGTLLANFSPPDDAHLELFVVPGGFVGSKNGGLTLGVMSGVNSDRDQTTRGSGLTSEPSLCVPARPTPDLGSAPWMLPYNAARKDYLLSPAGAFAGDPDPVDAMGVTQDVAIGLSRTFLDLAGFHIYNSGTLCLSIGGSAIPQLNAGTLSVIINSLGNIIDDRKAPLALVLRPQTPLNFTIGQGTMMDPLINVAIQDMRIDFYAWIEERYVRLLTIGLDLNAGLNLGITKNAQMQPELAPMLVGLNSSNITIRISNTDLLQEKPDDLAKVFPSLLNIATGALGNVIPPIALPSVSGFSLDDLSIQKVQTTQDDFIGIFGTIVDSSPLGLIDWSNPHKPRSAESIETVVKVADVHVPSAEQIHALFFPQEGLTPVTPDRPTVALDLDTVGGNGRAVEYAWKVDNGMWRVWSDNAHPVLGDDLFLLQGRHTIDVKARLKGDWLSEDATPERVTVLIDSMAPELHPVRSDDGLSLLFGGFDIVSDSAKLVYSWLDADGQQTAWTPNDRLPVDMLRALTNDGAKPFTLFVKDEAGNIGQSAVNLTPILGFHGRTTNPPAPGGCSCDVGSQGGNGGALALLLLGALVCLRRRSSPAAGGRTQVAVKVAVLALLALPGGCNNNASSVCSVDDDCVVKFKTKCADGQLPQCMGGACGCTPDVPPGETGRFSSMQMVAGDAYVSAYNTTYGDLMIGHVTPPGIVDNWDFVDGVPDYPPDVNGSHVRGGIMTPGDDVGRYTSIGQTLRDEPVIAYYDKTHGALKYASFGVIRWHSHVVDKGVTAPDANGGDDVGRWASLSMSRTGIPAIAYTAIVHSGTKSGMPESQLRWAQAKVKDPQSTSDWTVTILDSRVLGEGGPPMPTPSANPSATPMPSTAADVLLPEGIALMASAARRSDDSPAVAYYDRVRGNLRYVEWVPSANAWSDPMILDGEDASGFDTGDVGQYPSLGFDMNDVGQVSYVDATHDNLLHVDTMNLMPEIVDDGYRPADEMTLDGLPSPVYHLVGDSSSLQVINGKLVVAYQDSTVVTLRVAVKDPMTNMWQLGTIAGHAMAPFKGSFGFYACLRKRNANAVVASYGINQQLDTPLYFVEVFAVDLGSIM